MNGRAKESESFLPQYFFAVVFSFSLFVFFRSFFFFFLFFLLYFPLFLPGLREGMLKEVDVFKSSFSLDFTFLVSLFPSVFLLFILSFLSFLFHSFPSPFF